MTRSRLTLDSESMLAATTAESQPIRPFKHAGVQRTNPNLRPNDSMATYAERRAAYNRHTGVLLSLEAELLHAFREAEASGAVVQAPQHPEDWADRAVPATVPATRQVARRSSAVCMMTTVMALSPPLCAFLATYCIRAASS